MIKQLMEKMTIKTYDAMTALYPGRKKHTPRHDELLVGSASHLYQPKYTESLYLSVSERLQHCYVLGASGSGKSTLLYSLIIQDIMADRGFCLIDPHGDLSELAEARGGIWPGQRDHGFRRIADTGEAEDGSIRQFNLYGDVMTGLECDLISDLTYEAQGFRSLHHPRPHQLLSCWFSPSLALSGPARGDATL